MLNRFTERARRVVVLATDEARNRRHEAVGPEHVLMGILRDGGSPTAHMLEQLHVRPETLRAEVERVLSETPGSATGGDPTFSAELKAVLEVALSGKRRLTVSTDVLLLALAEGYPPIAAMLRASGASGADRRLRLMSVLMRNFRTPVTEEEVSFVATSRWRVRL
jgi:ATP-dependent Clp protease ATP-binding subunit ClpC